MAGGYGENSWQEIGNPFPHAAVARLRWPGSAALTIETPAVREAGQLVSGYLSVTRVPDSSGESGDHLVGKGKVCVIEGDYGTGKTHLAQEMLTRAESARGENGTDTRVFYHVVPGGNFLSLYSGLMKDAIGQAEIVARVRETYADIVAEALQDRPYTSALVTQLLRDDVDPQVVIDRYGLKEGALRDQLRRRLSAVTRNETFSRALMLLLQRDLQEYAWEWLVGGIPGTILAERGVTEAIATDVDAMDALGVVARLYGRRNRRFILVIDEMEKLAAAWGSGDVAHGQAFKRLLEVFHATGALLIVCGLPDVFEVLPRDPGRVDAIIRPSALTVGEVRWFIGQTMRRATGRDALDPFTRESAEYMVALTGGVARDVLRLCYYAFTEAAETGEEVTPSTIRQVARYRIPNGGAERARSDIEEILMEQGWPADRHRLLGGESGAPVDFWIPAGGSGSGCAVLVSDSILEDEEARHLAGQAAAVVTGSSRRTAILVIGGYLPDRQRQLMSDVLGDQALVVYHARTFAREFAQALSQAMERVGGIRAISERSGGRDTDEIRVLRAETERISRQQASTLRALQELLQQSDALTAAVTELRRPTGPPAEAGASLPIEVDSLFSRAKRSLDAYGDVREFLDRTFEIAAREPGQRFPLTHRLRTGDTFGPLGIATYLADLLAGFQSSVRSWLAAVGPGGERVPSSDEWEWLHGICQTYDSLYGVAQVYRLDPLPDLINLGNGEDREVPPSRSARREELEAAFGDLGDRVYQAAMEAVGAEPDADA